MPAGDEPAGDKAIFDYLKEHDPQGLSAILQDRMRHVVQQQKESADKPAAAAATLTNFDLTAPVLPAHRPVSEHVHFVRDHDWTDTLGPMSTWSPELRTWVNFLLSHTRAACIWWGPRRIAIYNEPYKSIVAHRHPAALASPMSEVWPELVDTPFGRSCDHADQTGNSSSGDRGVFFLERANYLEEIWASWNVIPILGPNGNVGYYNAVIESTQEVLTRRRFDTLHTLAQATSEVAEVRDFWHQVLQGLASNPDEVPFAALYGAAPNLTRTRPQAELRPQPSDNSTDDSTSIASSAFSGTEWALEGTISFELPGVTPLPYNVDLDSGSELLTPAFTSAMESRSYTLLAMDEQAPRLKDVARSRKYAGEQCRTIAFLPILSNAEDHKSGFLLLGLNTRRELDLDYRRFIMTLHLQLTNAFTAVVIAEMDARKERIASKSAAKDRGRLVKRLATSQQETEYSELRFRSMADLAPIGIFTFDTDGNPTYVNQYFSDLLSSVSPGDGNALHNAILEDDRKAFCAQWEDLLAGKEIHFEARLHRKYQTEETYAGERLEGETWILIAAYAIGEHTSGTVNEIFGCLVDISRQKWMEGFHTRRLREQQERSRQQENFMDTTSHEARNPLAAITLCADDLYATLKSLPGTVNTDHTSPGHLVLERDTLTALLDSVEIIIACAKHQKRIIDDVLTLSKLDSNMLVTSAAPVQPTEVIAEALRMFQAELKQSDVALAYTVHDSYRDNGVDWVMLDGTRFLQILINLLNNAIKFTKPELSRKITITIQASLRRPRAEDHGVNFAPPTEPKLATAPKSPEPSAENIYLYVAIEDTGPGLIASEIETLFQRFQQASAKTYAQYGGSGLGLWISKELCGKLGGEIGVATSGTSKSGSTGATFAFYVSVPRCSPPPTESQHVVLPTDLPILDPNMGETPVPVDKEVPAMPRSYSASVAISDLPGASDNVSTPARSKAADTTTKKTTAVLVVEDNLINQRVMRKQLVQAGFHVSVANHGKEALEILFPATGGSDTDIVLMDIEMPVMDGVECTRAIRAKENHMMNRKRLPILGVTANVRAEQQAAAMEAGMDTVVTKPFHMADLLAAIAEGIGSS